jgi:CHAD domain-containing protein
LKPLVSRIEDRRRAARARLLDVLDSDRYARLVAKLRAALARGPETGTPVARMRITEFAPPVLTRRYKRVRRMGARLSRKSDPAEFHALRICTKRLRYAIEFVRDVYPKSSKRLVGRLVAFQDLLGEHQDAQVAMAHLRELADDDDLALASRALLALGRVTERYERRAADLRAGFRKTFDRIRGKTWKRFRREMRRARG